MATSPKPDQIRALRTAAGLTQTQAAAMVHGSLRSWQEWEAGDADMHPGLWALFYDRAHMVHVEPMTAAAVDAFVAEWRDPPAGKTPPLSVMSRAELDGPIDYSLKAGDMVYDKHWWDGVRPVEVVDLNWALRAGAFRLAPRDQNGEHIVVWPMAGKSRKPFEKEPTQGNPHPAGTLAHDVWNRGFRGLMFSGHPESVAAGWFKDGDAARHLAKRQKGGAQ